MGLLDNLEDNDSSTTSPARSTSYDRPGKLKNTLSLVGVILLIAIAVFGSLYVVKKKPELIGLTKNSAEENQKEVQKYVAEIGKLMLLPEETPTLATVTDVEKTKDQAFFKNAKEGDKVLVYTGAKKAILYRPSESKIIEVGYVNTAEPTGAVAGDKTNQISPVITIIPTGRPTSTPLASPTISQRVTSGPTPTQ